MASPSKITPTTILSSPTGPRPWTHHLTIDTFYKVLQRTLFNPFLAWVLVLCLRAHVTPTTDLAWILAVAYASMLTAIFVAQTINHRVAHGIPRTIDSEREVVLVTGGASGLGLLIAQMYSMKGASVAVLDIKDVGEHERDELFGEGVVYLRCDVRCPKALEDAKVEIEKEVCLCYYVSHNEYICKRKYLFLEQISSIIADPRYPIARDTDHHHSVRCGSYQWPSNFGVVCSFL